MTLKLYFKSKTGKAYCFICFISRWKYMSVAVDSLLWNLAHKCCKVVAADLFLPTVLTLSGNREILFLHCSQCELSWKLGQKYWSLESQWSISARRTALVFVDALQYWLRPTSVRASWTLRRSACLCFSTESVTKPPAAFSCCFGSLLHCMLHRHHVFPAEAVPQLCGCPHL